MEGTRYDDADGALQEMVEELDSLIAYLADRDLPYWKLEPYGTEPVKLCPSPGITPVEIDRGPVCGDVARAVALCISRNRDALERHYPPHPARPTLTPRGKWLDSFKRDAGPGR